MRHKKRKFKINGYVLFSALILIVLVFIQTFLLTQPKITSKNDDTTQTSTKNSTAKKDSPTKLEKESTHMTISSKKICLLSRQNQKIYNWRRTLQR